MRRKKSPPNVERNVVKGHVYFSFRIGKGQRTRLPADPTSDEFRQAYVAAMAGADTSPKIDVAPERSINALIVSYYRTSAYTTLRETSKKGYRSRLEQMRLDHGHRAVAGLSKERINEKIIDPIADRPGAALDTLKKLRILIRHALDLKWLSTDPSAGIKRPRTRVRTH